MKQIFIYKDKDDYQIWQELKNGNELSFELIFKKYYDLLFNYGLNIISDQNLVEDVIQDFFIDIWKKKEKLGDAHSIKYYLLVSYRRLLFKRISKESKINIERIENYLDQIMVDSQEEVIIRHKESADRKKTVSSNINKLSTRQREIIYLKFYKNLSYQEISVVMEINYQSTRNLLFAAIKTLKSNLSKKDIFSDVPKIK